MAPTEEHPTERALSMAGLPDRLDGWRVLALGGDFGRAYLAGIGASELVSVEKPRPDAALEAGDFDLVICGSDLETNAHPLGLYAWARRAIKPKGTLIAGSRVLADPARSQYARFLPAAGPDAASRWLPGRLAFRWMVEVSGFDVDGWLGGAEEMPEGEQRAYLQGRPAERSPALDLDRQPLRP